MRGCFRKHVKGTIGISHHVETAKLSLIRQGGNDSAPSETVDRESGNAKLVQCPGPLIDRRTSAS